MPKYFTDKEFACRCGRAECDAPKSPSEALLTMLDAVRERLGKPMVVNSGTRCGFWNTKQGGAKDSEHLTGEGADILCTSSQDRMKLIRAALMCGFDRIGVGKDFVHLGSSQTHVRQVIWHYYGK